MTQDKGNYIIAGIGASAGGLEALRQTLPSLPDQEDIAYVIVQHMDPHHQSMLPSLLAPSTNMTVKEAKNNQPLAPNEIYITPSGYDITLEGSRLVLRKSETSIGPKPSIDRFLSSLAAEKGERSVGIILSGTGTDGAHGMRAIKAGGGITIAQAPETAKYDGMPAAAIETGSIDLILSPESIGQELVSILHSPLLVSDASSVEVAPDDMGNLMALLRKHTGYDFSEYKENTLQRRIKRRLAVHKLQDLKAYVAYAQENPSDLQGLVKDILISVTSYFRDRDAFDALKKIIPELADQKNNGLPLRVWVPGCASGEEAYSLAILFAEHFGPTFDNANLQFYATDIDADIVAQARKGIYPAASLENLDKNIIRKYFVQDNGTFRVIKSIRERIVFAKQDIINDPPFSRLDLIACRNLLIYFKTSLQSRLITMFHYVLNNNGILFLGKSESVSHCADLFEPVSKKWRIFRRKDITNKYTATPRGKKLLGYEFERVLQIPGKKAELSLRETINHAISNVFGPPAVLLNSRLELLYVRGDASKYFQIGEGSTGLNALDLARHEIRSILRASIHKAIREHQTVISKKNRLQLPDGKNLYINLHVHPLDFEGAPEGYLLVAFEEEKAPDLKQQVEISDTDTLRDQRIVELEHELAAAYERLQTTVEELETSNEELQSLNEELQSANEELQSTNEELETSNEELQATNEELSTVNQELQIKSSELSEAHSDLENVFRRMEIPLIVIDKNMRVRRFTPSVSLLFSIMPGDRGQVVTNLGTQVTIPDFRQTLEEVLENGDTVNQLIETANKIYELKIFPYYEEDETITGALLTFYDITSTHRRKQEFQALAENAPDIVTRFDTQLRHLYVNQTIERYTAKKCEEFIGKTNRELGMPDVLCSYWEGEITKPLNTRKEHSFDFEFPTPDGLKSFESRVVPEFSADGRVVSLLVVARDITSKKKHIKELNDTLGSISDGFFSLDAEMRVTYFNEAAGKLLNIEPASVIGQKLFDVFFQGKGSIFEEKYREALESKQFLAFEAYFDKDPYRNWYSVRVYPKDNGISVYFQVTTAQKEAEAEILRQQEMLKAIIDNVPVLIIVYDPEMKILLVNNAFKEKTGWSQDEIQSINIMEKCYPDPDDRAQALAYMKKASADWKEFTLTARNGDNLATIWSNVRLGDGTQIGIGLDITESKKNETTLQEKQKIEALGTLAGGIAHDFNNILATILGYAEIVREDLPDSSPSADYLDKILKASNRAAELVEQILTFSRKQQVKKQALQPAAMVEEALKFIRASIPTSINIHEEIDKDCGLIMANPTNLHQVMVNLCTNAAHAMDNQIGDITIRLNQVKLSEKDLSSTPEVKPGDFVKIYVKDNGCGMDPETLKRLFEPYFTTKEVGKGSGMGLAMVHGIVKNCDGFIKVESEPGKGTTFRVYFPVVQDEQPSPEATQQHETNSSIDGNEKILVVDDEQAIVEMMQNTLERHGYRVIGTESSQHALDLFTASPDNFDLIITDQTMPKLPGAELASKILKIRKDIPIILCTGYSSVISEEDAHAIGIRKYLMKPVDRKTLAQIVREVLDLNQ